MLERNIEVRQDLAIGHQRDDLINMRIGIDIMQPDPCAQTAQFTGKIEEFGAHLAALP